MKKIAICLLTALVLLIPSGVKAEELNPPEGPIDENEYEVIPFSDSTTTNIISNVYGSVKVKFSVSGTITKNYNGSISYEMDSYGLTILNYTMVEPVVTLQNVSVYTSAAYITISAQIRTSWNGDAEIKYNTMIVTVHIS